MSQDDNKNEIVSTIETIKVSDDLEISIVGVDDVNTLVNSIVPKPQDINPHVSMDKPSEPLDYKVKGIAIFKSVEAEVKGDLGELWAKNKDKIKQWAINVAYLESLILEGIDVETVKETMDFAKAGINSLKANLSFKIQNIAIKAIGKVLGYALRYSVMGALSMAKVANADEIEKYLG